MQIDYTWEILDWCELVHVKCEWARINQDYPKEDLPLLLQDIEELIRSEQLENKNTNINIRVKSKEKLEIQKYAQEAWYKTLSEYVLARKREKVWLALIRSAFFIIKIYFNNGVIWFYFFQIFFNFFRYMVFNSLRLYTMQLWNLNIVFIEKLTVRDFQAINRLNEKLRLKEIDEISLSNELSKLIIRSINWVYDKEKIEKYILDMDSILYWMKKLLKELMLW